FAPTGVQPTAAEDVQSAVSAVSVRKVVPLEESTLADFWAEVLAASPDRLAGHLEKTDGVAISGPNVLELSFPLSYALSRQFCERPETLGRVAELASQIAGRTVTVRVVASAKVAEAPVLRKMNPPKEPVSRQKRA